MPGFNTVSWFEVGTDDPATAQRFYGEVFGWTLDADADPAYRNFTAAGEERPSGGLFDTAGRYPNYAIFHVLVEDVEDTCRRVEAAGGKVQRPAQSNPGGVTFAHVTDPGGNHFGVFSLSQPA
jgi:predicted enzyme related to lactoylglutathione lyase